MYHELEAALNAQLQAALLAPQEDDSVAREIAFKAAEAEQRAERLEEQLGEARARADWAGARLQQRRCRLCSVRFGLLLRPVCLRCRWLRPSFSEAMREVA